MSMTSMTMTEYQLSFISHSMYCMRCQPSDFDYVVCMSMTDSDCELWRTRLLFCIQFECHTLILIVWWAYLSLYFLAWSCFFWAWLWKLHNNIFYPVSSLLITGFSHWITLRIIIAWNRIALCDQIGLIFNSKFWLFCPFLARHLFTFCSTPPCFC